MFRNGRACERQCAGCKAFTAVRKAASPAVDQLVSVSEHVLRQHRSLGYFKEVPASVIYNVMDAPLSAPMGTGSGALVFGYIGKLEEPKGIQILLEATKLLTGSDWRLKIAGNGIDTYVRGLRERFPDPRIDWLGFVSPAEFYFGIDVVVVPSMWADPLPYVTIEALFAGKSLIVAESGGIPEIASLGKTAGRFPAGDSVALAAEMELALSDPERWRNGGFLDPEDAARFAPSTVAEAYLARYQSSPLPPAGNLE
jgi:glycosyltransferase involved in cell wall biosynthesis